MRSAGMRVLILCFVVTFMVSCSTPTGPSLTKAVLRNVALKSTTGNTALCCCHVVGTAENDNAVPVHLTLEFSAFDSHNNALETIVQFVADLQAGHATIRCGRIRVSVRFHCQHHDASQRGGYRVSSLVSRQPDVTPVRESC